MEQNAAVAVAHVEVVNAVAEELFFAVVEHVVVVVNAVVEALNVEHAAAELLNAEHVVAVAAQLNVEHVVV